MQQVSWTKISTQQVTRIKINTKQAPWTHSVSRGENQCKGFTKRKIKMQQVSRRQISIQQFLQTKNQHATNSMNKISLTMSEVNELVSAREKLRCNKFHEQKSSRNKFHEQITRGEKSIYNLHEEKNYICNKFHKQKSKHSKFHEQN